MKYQMMILKICCLSLLFMNAHGQYKHIPESIIDGHSLTGNLQYDLSTDVNRDEVADGDTIQRKIVYRKMYSPLTAGLFSAIIPGAGQFYTKSYEQSAAFFGAEVLMWVLYATYENKGNRQTETFQQYANDYWSVVRYARWLKNSETEASNYTFEIPNTQSLPPSQQIDWKQLNLCEEEIGKREKSGFTHKLDPYGTQQYYEMIGKYAQFGGGWEDAWNGNNTIFYTDDILTQNVTKEFLDYRDKRGKANSFYNIASTVSYVIVANHVFSALEAAWNASRINHKIKLQGHIESRQIYRNMVEFVPTLRINCEL